MPFLRMKPSISPLDSGEDKYAPASPYRAGCVSTDRHSRPGSVR